MIMAVVAMAVVALTVEAHLYSESAMMYCSHLEKNTHTMHTNIHEHMSMTFEEYNYEYSGSFLSRIGQNCWDKYRFLMVLLSVRHVVDYFT